LGPHVVGGTQDVRDVHALLIGVEAREFGVEVLGDRRAHLLLGAADQRKLVCGRRQRQGARTSGAERRRDRPALAVRRDYGDRLGKRAAFARDLGEAPAQRRPRGPDIENPK
jgi:hypothetical protein